MALIKTWGLILFMVAVPELISCSSEPERDLPNVLAFESEHFRYYTRESSPTVCPELKDQLEAHFTAHKEQFHFEWPKETKINYYKFLDLEDYLSFIDNDDMFSHTEKQGKKLSVLSNLPIHQHELIHAYFAFTGRPIKLLSEGVAETLSNGTRCIPDTTEPTHHTLSELFDADMNTVYVSGCRWAGHLLNTYGPDKFMELYAAIDNDDSLDTVNGQFERILEIDAESTWNDTQNNTIQQKNVFNFWQCATAHVDIQDETTINLLPDCAIPVSHRTIVIPEDGHYRIRHQQPFFITSCHENSFSIYIEFPVPQETESHIFLPKGAYVVGYRYSASNPNYAPPNSTEITLTKETDYLFHTDCTKLSEPTASDTRNYIYYPAGLQPLNFWLTPTETIASPSLSAYSFSNQSVEVETCSGCSSDGSYRDCQPADPNVSSLIDGDSVFQRITFNDASNGNYCLLVGIFDSGEN